MCLAGYAFMCVGYVCWTMLLLLTYRSSCSWPQDPPLANHGFDPAAHLDRVLRDFRVLLSKRDDAAEAQLVRRQTRYKEVTKPPLGDDPHLGATPQTGNVFWLGSASGLRF